MAKVKFDNHTGHTFEARFPGARVRIPAHATGDKAYIAELPEIAVVGKWITDLTTRYRAVTASLVEDEPDDAVVVVETPTEPKVVDEDVKETPVMDEPVIVDPGNGDVDPFEIFKASVSSAIEGGGGWWTVIVEGIQEPIKVRGCKDKNQAVLEAYEKHMEG